MYLSGTGFLVLTNQLHAVGSRALSGVGVLSTPGAVGTHTGVSAPKLLGHGTLVPVGRVIQPFRPDRGLVYTVNAVPYVLQE